MQRSDLQAISDYLRTDPHRMPLHVAASLADVDTTVIDDAYIERLVQDQSNRLVMDPREPNSRPGGKVPVMKSAAPFSPGN